MQLERPTLNNRTIVYNAALLFDCPDCPANAGERCMSFCGCGPKHGPRHMYTPSQRTSAHARRRRLGEFSIANQAIKLDMLRDPNVQFLMYSPEKYEELFGIPVTHRARSSYAYAHTPDERTPHPRSGALPPSGAAHARRG